MADSIPGYFTPVRKTISLMDFEEVAKPKLMKSSDDYPTPTTGFASDQETTSPANSENDLMTSSSSDHESTMSRSPEHEFVARSGQTCFPAPFDSVLTTELQLPSNPETVPVPNVGSALHGTGDCRPCAFFWKSVGCQSDQNCSYCHFCPDGSLKARKKSKLAMRKQEAKYALYLASLI